MPKHAVMNSKAAAITIALVLTVPFENASAAPQHCGNVTGEATGKGPGAGTMLSPGEAKAQYEHAFAAATRVALVAWAKKVSDDCPADAASWSRATSRSVFECDRAMGGRFTVCATGMPAPK